MDSGDRGESSSCSQALASKAKAEAKGKQSGKDKEDMKLITEDYKSQWVEKGEEKKLLIRDLKFDLDMKHGQSRRRMPEVVEERHASLTANPPSGPIGNILVYTDKGISFVPQISVLFLTF